MMLPRILYQCEIFINLGILSTVFYIDLSFGWFDPSQQIFAFLRVGEKKLLPGRALSILPCKGKSYPAGTVYSKLGRRTD